MVLGFRLGGAFGNPEVWEECRGFQLTSKPGCEGGGEGLLDVKRAFQCQNPYSKEVRWTGTSKDAGPVGMGLSHPLVWESYVPSLSSTSALKPKESLLSISWLIKQFKHMHAYSSASSHGRCCVGGRCVALAAGVVGVEWEESGEGPALGHTRLLAT